MKKWLLLIPASVMVLGCTPSTSHTKESPETALPVSVADTPPPVQLWEEDPDYQEDQAGGTVTPPVYDSLGRRIVPTKVTNNPPRQGKLPGKGVSDRPPTSRRILDSLDRVAAQRNKYRDSLRLEEQKKLKNSGGK